MRYSSPALFTLALSLWTPVDATACTTILIGKSLTADGSVIHAHNEDMGNEAVGRLWFTPATSHAEGSRFGVPYVQLERSSKSASYWASGNAQGGVGLGIAEGSRPYDDVLVGLNQHGVSMSCNWAHSKAESREGVGIRRYAIRQLLLERATSARHGVEILGELIEQHGQADWSGLIYNLADPQEAWVVETTTRNWVARRVRDDEIHVTANRFRIGSDYDLASASLIRDAVAHGWLDKPEEPLDFGRVYGKPERMNEAYDTRREARVLELLDPKRGELTPEDIFAVLLDRYEGTADYTRPQTEPVWREDLQDRPDLPRTINTNLAQSTFVAHLRGDLPTAVGAMMWFGIGTPSWAGYIPLYAGSRTIPEAYSQPDAKARDSSAWWLFRRLQRTADGDYDDLYPATRAFLNQQLAAARRRQQAAEAKALKRWHRGAADESRQTLSDFTADEAERALRTARQLLERIQ